MLYNLLAPLTSDFAPLNLFRYITFRTGGAVVTALIIGFVLGPPMIRWLKKRQNGGQPIREDGPKSHLLTKKGTPTMGGMLILIALTISTLLWADLTNGFVWVCLFVTVGFGAVGFVDDYRKLTKRSHKGLSGRGKLIAQGGIGLVATFWIVQLTAEPMETGVAIPFVKAALVPLGWFFLVWGAFVMVGTSNAVNLTDGLDGLAIGPVLITTSCFVLIAYLVGNTVFANYLQIHYVRGSGELAVFCGALIGAGLGFL